MSGSHPLVEVRALRKEFAAPGGRAQVTLQDVSLGISHGEAVGLAGMSGSGKSTLGRIILGLDRPTSGDVLFEGRSILGLDGADLRAVRGRMQMVFQIRWRP